MSGSRSRFVCVSSATTVLTEFLFKHAQCLRWRKQSSSLFKKILSYSSYPPASSYVNKHLCILLKELIGIISAWQMKIVCDALTWSPALWRMEKAAQAWLSSSGRSHKAEENSYASFLLPLRRNWRSPFHSVWAKCFCWVFANFLKLQIFFVEVEPLKLWQLLPCKECFSHSALFSNWKACKQNCVITAKSCPYPWIWDVA